MEFILSLAIKAFGLVWTSLQHNWPYLAASVVIATLLKLYVNAEKVSAFLNRYRGAGIFAATTVAVATPLCSCGTTAVILGLMASRMAWAPIVAFMVASPLTSPEGLVYSAGLFGWPFAWAFYMASIVLGLAGGWVAAALESRGWLANQTRFAEPVASCGCGQAGTLADREQPGPGCACSSSGSAPGNKRAAPQKTQVTGEHVRLATILKELYSSGKYLLIMFVGFAFVGYFLNGLIPAHWVSAVFGSGNVYNVALAATLGLPFYINSEASLPLVRTLLDAGMSQGAALAFLIAGAGTSLGAIGGALTIARWRIVGLVVGTLWIGAIACGYAFDLALRVGAESSLRVALLGLASLAAVLVGLWLRTRSRHSREQPLRVVRG